MSNENKPSIHETVTAKIVAALEAGAAPWQKQWKGGVSRPLRSTGERYQGINVLILWCAAMERGYTSPYWFTFKQAQALKGCVRKGEKGTHVVYYATFTKEKTNDAGDTVESKIPFLKTYGVFNAEQIDGLPAKYATPEETTTTPFERIENAREFFHNVGADVRTGGVSAFYSPSGDFIQMPEQERFIDATAYESVMAHETIHWTGHASRENRLDKMARFGSEAYAFEELVAELGSAFLCADLQIENEPRPDHASYIASWVKVLRNDHKAIFNAASLASAAVARLHGHQPNNVEAAAEMVEA